MLSWTRVKALSSELTLSKVVLTVLLPDCTSASCCLSPCEAPVPCALYRYHQHPVHNSGQHVWGW